MKLIVYPYVCQFLWYLQITHFNIGLYSNFSRAHKVKATTSAFVDDNVEVRVKYYILDKKTGQLISARIQCLRKLRCSNNDVFRNACLLYAHHRIERRVCQIRTAALIFASPCALLLCKKDEFSALYRKSVHTI